MNAYHDLLDWLGGLPYEVASENEIVQFAIRHGFALQGIRTASEGACSVYVMRSVPSLLAHDGEHGLTTARGCSLYS